jgi:hypothetical protein
VSLELLFRLWDENAENALMRADMSVEASASRETMGCPDSERPGKARLISGYLKRVKVIDNRMIHRKRVNQTVAVSQIDESGRSETD